MRFVGFASGGVPDMLAMSGILYFELELITALEGPQIRFVTERFRRADRGISEGVGDDSHGWAVDGHRGLGWFGGASNTWACRWAAGDVIGFAANIDAGKMAVAKNGSWTGDGCGVVFQDVDLKVGVYPAMTISKGEVRYHLTAPFRHGPPRAEVWVRPIFEDATVKAVTGSALLAASDAGDVNAVRAALETGADTNATAEHGVTALMLAARAGSGGAVQALLAKGAVAALRSREGYSALDLAVKAGAVDCARLLIEKGGANVDAAGGARELTPLLHAAADGHEAVVKVLLANGAQVDQTRKDGASVLMLSCQNGHEQCARALIEAGAAVDTQNRGYTALMLCCEKGHEPCARALIEAGADVNVARSDGNTALILCCINGHELCVRALIEAKAATDTQNNRGRTALMACCVRGHEKCARALIQAGVDVNVAPSDGYTALMHACSGGHDLCARALIEARAAVDATKEDGYTALMFCCKNGHEQCVRALVEAKANIHAKHKDKDTALDIARREGHTVVCQLLEKEDPT